MWPARGEAEGKGKDKPLFLWFASGERPPPRTEIGSQQLNNRGARMQGFPLTGLQQFTAVTDICFRIRKAQPYLLNLR